MEIQYELLSYGIPIAALPIDFNGEWSPFGAIAKKMRDNLEDAFESITMGKRKRKSRVNYNEIVQNSLEAEDDYNEETNTTTKKRSTSGSSKKKVPYNTLAKQLRDTEKKLKAEQALVMELEKKLAERDLRIKQLKTERKKEKRRKRKRQAREEEVVADDPGRTAKKSTSTFELPKANSTSSAQAGAKSGCHICGKDDDYERLLICDGCNDECHIYCLNPPLYTVPKDDWYCCKYNVGFFFFTDYYFPV